MKHLIDFVAKSNFFSGAWLKVISEVPFDMFTTASFFNMNWNNVMFTLALVLIVIWSIDILKDKMQKNQRYSGIWYRL